MIISTLSVVFSYSQVTLISALEDKDYKVNQKITLTFVLKIEGNEYVQESPLRLPDFSKFNVIGNASDQNSYVDPEKKIIINQMVYQWVVSPKQPGKIRIGSALVDVNGRTYKTEPIDIEVKEADKKSGDGEDAYLSLEVDKKQVYENQPVKAVLRLFSKDIDNFRRVENVQFSAPNAVRIQPLSLAKSDIESVAQSPDWSSQVLAVYLVFPEKPGTAVIPKFSANIKHADNATKITSPLVKISVKNFPKAAPAGYKNITGSHFSLSLTSDDGDGNADENTYQINKPVHVFLRFSGDGNFDEASLPVLQPSQDYIFYPPAYSDQRTVSENGHAGMIAADYLVIPKKTGKINITTDNFTYFNPENRKFATLAPSVLSIDVLSQEEIDGNKSPMETVAGYTNHLLNTVRPANRPARQTEKNTREIARFWPWAAIMLVTVFRIFMWRRKKNKIRPRALAVHAAAGDRESRYDLDFLPMQQDLYEKNYPKFFDDFDGFLKIADEKAHASGFKNIAEYAEATQGNRLAESLRAVMQKIRVEKFAPEHSEAQMQDLFSEIQEVFSPLQNSQ